MAVSKKSQQLQRPLVILLVEDHPSDRALAMRAIKQVMPTAVVRHAGHGQSALESIATEGIPDLILLDLMMPVMDGWEFLHARSQLTGLTGKSVPTIALSTSERQKDVDRAYEAGANAYICKPVEPTDFRDTITQLRDFWVSTARLPGP